MSADAKVWQDFDDDHWHGIHDGECKDPESHHGTEYDMTDVIISVEKCMGRRLRWEFFMYKDGPGLRGFEV